MIPLNATGAMLLAITAAGLVAWRRRDIYRSAEGKTYGLWSLALWIAWLFAAATWLLLRYAAMHPNNHAARLSIEVLGWCGDALIVGAYLFVTFKKLTPGSVWYALLNITGATGVIAISYQKHAWQPLALNVVWVFAPVATYMFNQLWPWSQDTLRVPPD